MNKYYETILEVLREDKRFFTEDGELLRNAVVEASGKMDVKLIRALYNNETTRARFFTNVDGIAVFDKVAFGYVINNREFLPDSYTRYKNKIGLVNDHSNFISGSHDVELAFPYKDCVLEFDSTKETEARNEIFFNELLAAPDIDRLLYPKVFTNAHRFSSDGDEPTTLITSQENIIIKGNNLIALHSLLPRFRGAIKCMYWDILYNTDNDKVPYNDSFKHSSWLVMMKNRLEVALALLSPNSVIVIECDKNEDAYLKVLCDEIFGRDNFINSVTVQSSTPSGTKLAHRDKTILKTKDTLLLYRKGCPTINPQYTTSDNLTNFNYWFEKNDNGDIEIRNLRDILIEKGLLTRNQHIDDIRMSSNPSFEKFIVENASYIFRKQPSLPDEMKAKSKKNPSAVYSYDDDGVTRYCQNGYRFAFLSDSVRLINGEKKVTQLLCDIWTDISFHGTQYEGNVDLPAGKKPERLIKRIIDLFMKPGDIFLDAYLGSGTSAVVAQKMGIQYIGIEQLDLHFEKAKSRLQYVISGKDAGPVSKELDYLGGGSFVYCELAKLNQSFVDRIQCAEDDAVIAVIYEDIIKTGFISYKVNPKDIDTDSEDFKSLSLGDKKRLLMELLDKNQLYINYCDMEDETFAVSAEDKAFTKSFYGEV